jgi:hypothetical protein
MVVLRAAAASTAAVVNATTAATRCRIPAPAPRRGHRLQAPQQPLQAPLWHRGRATRLPGQNVIFGQIHALTGSSFPGHA